MRNQIHLGDSAEVLRTFPDASITDTITDPPYGLGTRQPTGADIDAYLAGSNLSTNGDFLGMDWEIPPVPLWREVYRAMKPGGILMSFAGSRTLDLMAAGIEAAGFTYIGNLGYLYGCLSEDTEVLTETGWKLGVDVVVGEKVANWDPKTGALTLGSVEAVTLAPWSGDLVRFVNDDIDQLLTPNHRVFHRSRQRHMVRGKRLSWYEKTWEVTEAGKINRAVPIKLPVAGLHDGPGIGGVDYATLLGWVWTEGGFDKAPNKGVRIYQSESANPDTTAEIDTLVTKMEPGRSRYDRTRVYTYKGISRPYSETCWYFAGELAAQIRRDLPEKHPTWALLWQMTLLEKQAFWAASMKGDGDEQGAFYQKSHPDLNWAQALLTTIGRRGKINMRKTPREGGSLSTTPRDTTELQCRALKVTAQTYEGQVWCLQVPTGAFVARRKGLVFITGNSGFPKSMNIGKALAKMNRGAPQGGPDPLKSGTGEIPAHNALGMGGQTGKAVTGLISDFKPFQPGTADEAQWSEWGTALKPAWEPILVFSKGPTDWRMPLVPFFYTAKAAKSERNDGLDDLPEPAMHLAEDQVISTQSNRRCTVCDRMKFGQPHCECEEPDWEETVGSQSKNFHPSVKPKSVMRWLVRLSGCKPEDLILDPFLGSGTTAVACVEENVGYVGIERDPEFHRIATARVGTLGERAQSTRDQQDLFEMQARMMADDDE